jgi:hypothetical protein
MRKRHGLVVGLAVFVGACASQKTSTESALDQFTAPGVPTMGQGEVAQTRNLPAATTRPTWPGKGLEQHPFLYGGEGYNVIQLVRGGKVVWTYSTDKKGEIDDAWMLSNGNVIFTRQFSVLEVTPDKHIVWQYDCPEGTECHSVQPIGLGKALIMQNGLPPKLMLINTGTGAVEMEHKLPAPSTTDPKTVHGQVRHARLTAAGTYLIPFLSMNKVVEYDKDWKEIFSVDEPAPWAAIRLASGNILISGNGAGWVREVNRNGNVVWEVTKNDLPGISLHMVQEVDRLANGDTIITSNGTGSRKDGPANYQTSVQLVEVNPQKKVVWVVQDWQTLGPASWVQLLDEPGAAENGDLQR